MNQNNNITTKAKLHALSHKIYFVSLKKTTHSPTQATFRYTIVGNLNDRSILSDEMANMCAKYPIHLIRRRRPLSAELEKKEQIEREYNRSQIYRSNIKYKESLTRNLKWILSPKMLYKVFYKVNRLSQIQKKKLGRKPKHSSHRL